MPGYPEIELIAGVGTWDTTVEAVPDTGFEDGLAIPQGAAREVLAEPYTTLLRTADGTLLKVDAWYGSVELEGRVFQCEIVAIGNKYLLDREVLDRLEICFEYGQRVRLYFRDGRS